jgi:hypothetical protein
MCWRRWWSLVVERWWEDHHRGDGMEVMDGFYLKAPNMYPILRISK